MSDDDLVELHRFAQDCSVCYPMFWAFASALRFNSLDNVLDAMKGGDLEWFNP